MALNSLTTTFDCPAPYIAPLAGTLHDGMSAATAATSDWQAALPLLTGRRLSLRELRIADGASLLALLTTEEVTRFISPPPTTLEGFERFITWANEQRAAGQYVCYAIVPDGYDTAVGIIQIRQLGGSFETAEWGFAIGQLFWGTGLFVEAAEQVLAFAFDTLGVHRLEARAAAINGRGNGALRKMGACCEAVLHRSFSKNGDRLDQCLWSILAEDRKHAKAVWGPRVAVAAA